MPKLFLIGHLEMAATADQKKILLGYTMSVGWSEVKATAAAQGAVAPLLPWSWRGLERFQLWKHNSGGWTAGPVLKALAPGTFNALGLPDLTERLRVRHNDPATTPQWRDLEVDPNKSAAPIRVSSEDAGGIHWVAQLTELATAPYPLAQLLNLSFVIEAADTDLSNADSIALVPVPAKGLSSTTDYMSPGAFKEVQGGNAGYSHYDDDNGLGFPVLAECNCIAPSVPNTLKGFDQQTQIIPLQSCSFTDWQSKFLRSSPRLFSLPAFLDYLIRTETTAAAELTGMWGTLAEAGVAALRDVCGLADKKGPSGMTLLEYVGIAKVPTISDAAFSQVFAVQKTWKSFLAENLSGIADLRLLQGSFQLTKATDRDSSLDSGIVREWQRLYAIFEDKSRRLDHDRIFQKLWEKVLPLSGASAADQKDFTEKLTSGLGKDDHSLRTEFWLDGLAGLYWDAIVRASMANPNANNPYLTELLRRAKIHILARLGFAPGDPGDVTGRKVPEDWTPQGGADLIWTGLKSYFEGKVDAWQAQVSTEFVPITTWKTGREEETQNPQSVHLQFAVPVPHDQNTNEKEDFFRAIRGVGVLARRKGMSTWYTLNRNGLGDFEGKPILTDPVGIAVRPTYGPQLRNCLLDYNNEPLAGGSALGEIRGVPNAMESGNNREHLLAAQSHEKVEILALKYGWLHYFVTCGALNSGVIAPEIRKVGGDPRDWPATVADDAGKKLFQNAAEVVYQRLAQVGALRINHDPDVPAAERNLPEIPESVSPRARDLAWSATPDGSHVPLALLCPKDWAKTKANARSEYRFMVHLPQVNWKLWDRWVFSLPPRHQDGRPKPDLYFTDANQLNALREEVIGSCLAEATGDGNQLNRKAMPSVDDPALDRYLCLELLKEVAGDMTVVGSPKFLRVADPDKVRSGYWKCRSGAGRVVCQHSDQESVIADPDNKADTPVVTVSVKAGEVCALRISCCVPVEYQATSPGDGNLEMFAPDLLPGERVQNTETNRYVLRTSPYTLVLEGATKDVPLEKDLFDALSVVCRISGGNQPKSHIVAAWRPVSTSSTPLTSPTALLHIGSMQVFEQTWRWDGRPVPLHPALGSGYQENNPEEMAWITRMYGEMADSEHYGPNMRAVRPEDSEASAWSALHKSGCRTFEHEVDLSASSGGGEKGTHFRFSIRAFSRYAALMPDNLPAAAGVSARPEGFKVNADSDAGLAFKSIFVPSQAKLPMPVPRLRFVLPLTEGDRRPGSPNAAKRTPAACDLLAVCDDIAFDQAGLGEGLRAEVEIVRTGDPVKGTPIRYHVQFGHDFQIRTGKGDEIFAPFEDETKPPIVINMDQKDGPVGHFRDFDSRSTRFLGSSFIIPAPTPTDTRRAFDFRWWMASIRFRRTLVTRRAPVASGAQTLEYKPVDIAKWELVDAKLADSAPTAPYWIQLLPEFSVYETNLGTSSRVGDLIPKLSADAKTLTLSTRESDQPVTLKPTPTADPNAFRLYAVVTKRAYDFRGQFNQEVYVGVYVQVAKSATWKGKPMAGIPNLQKDFRVRIIEVQLPTARVPSGDAWVGPDDDQEKIWDAMYEVMRVKNQDVPGKDGIKFTNSYDARGRIVRISEPADSEGRARCELETQ